MTDLSDKLRENDCRRLLEQLLPSLPEVIRTILSPTPISSLSSDLPPLYYPTWENGKLTTTRGAHRDWSHLQSLNLSELQVHLKTLQFPEGTLGYFFFGQSYPYFKANLLKLQIHMSELLVYAAQHQHPDIIFVSDNSGIIIENNDDGYEVSWWGL